MQDWHVHSDSPDPQKNKKGKPFGRANPSESIRECKQRPSNHPCQLLREKSAESNLISQTVLIPSHPYYYYY